MKIGYVVSMFPCWSETFILNEIIDHSKNGLDVNIFSLKKFNEKMCHENAGFFIKKTEYPFHLLNPFLWFYHLFLIITCSKTYITVLITLLTLKRESNLIISKALIVFLLSPPYIRKAHAEKFTHMHAHFATYPALLAWIISCFNKIPFSITAHAHDIYVNQDLLPIFCDNASTIITISKFNKKFILEKMGKNYEEKVKVIHCGINTDMFHFSTNRPLLNKEFPLKIISIGRLSGIKGFSYLLDSLQLLKNDGVDFQCQIIGDGPQKEELFEKTLKLGLGGQVLFLGSRTTEEIPQYLDAADVFVLACANDRIEGHDGIPIVFMEAMSYGVPVIGTKISGIPELIRHGETGLCAIPEDPCSINENIQFLFNHPLEAEKMRTNARALIEAEFDIKASCRQLRKFFN